MKSSDQLAARLLLKFQATDTPSSIADALLKSRGQHLAYRHAISTDQYASARAALRDAAVYRAWAQREDPTHSDPAWGDGGGLHPAAGGVLERDQQDDLLQFYADQLGLITHG